MALYHKWDVKNDFAYVFQFFSLISDGLGGVLTFGIFLKFYKDCVSLCSIIRVKSPPPVEIGKIECSFHRNSSPCIRVEIS